MARGVTLDTMVDDLRKEARFANSAAIGQNARPSLVALLQRKQEKLWREHDWAFLRVRRDKVLQAGQRYYSFFDDLGFERVTKVEIKWSGQWRPVTYGITSDQYNSLDPDMDIRQDPVLRWQEYEDNQFEVWPLPATNGTSGGDMVLRFHGIKNLDPFVSGSDRCTLDDKLIVLFAAAEIMAGAKQQDAPAKLQEARDLFIKLTGSHNNKRAPFVMGGGEPEPIDERDRVQVIYARAG